MWQVLPVFLIRSAGFDFELLARLRMPRSSSLAATAARCELRLSELDNEFHNRLLPAILESEQATGADRSAFRRWYRLGRDVRRRRAIVDHSASSSSYPGLAVWVSTWNRALSDLSSACGAFHREFETELASARVSLHEAAAGSRFQEAVFLSNPDMYSIALPSYRKQYRAGRRNAKLKYVERQVYGYLQRFCSKNDTTSFFGPIDYGSFDEAQERRFLLHRNGHGSPSRRLTRLSYWAAQELAYAIAREADVKPFLAPRLRDGCAVLSTGEVLVAARNRRIRLPEPTAAALRSIDGVRTTEELGAALSAVPKQLLTTNIVIPTAAFDPLAWLRERVAALPQSCASRRTWLARLDELRGSLDTFAGLPLEDKAATLARVERQFRAWTGVEERRRAGETYADRLVLYDEARGDVLSCTAGAPMQHELTRALGPVLDLCASYSAVVQQVCRERALPVFEHIGGGRPVPYLAFIRAVEAEVNVRDCIAAPAVRQFLDGLRTTTRNALEPDGVVRICEAALAPLRRAVAAGTPVSPDLLFSAADTAGIEQGRYQIVVGEIHHGVQVWSHFLALHPDPAGLEAGLAALFGEPQLGKRAGVVYSRQQGKVFPLELPGFSIEVLGRSAKPRSLILNPAELMVARRPAGALTLLHEDEALELYPGDPRAASNWIFGAPPVVAPLIEFGSVTPRIEIENVVFQRASWTLPCREWTCEAESSALMLRAAALRSRYRMPARGFVRVPAERKPFYLDLDSALSLEYFASVIRNSETFRFSEMLPGEGDLWFAGCQGRRTSEWRTTFVYADSR